jgi:beta-N-acetylhexosaminidase
MNRSRGPAHLRGLALATLFPGFSGTIDPPAWLAELIRKGLGGVVLFGRNVDASRGDDGVTALTGRLRADRPDLLVAIDEEGGDVTRLDVTTGSDLPGSAALGAVDDPLLTRDVAASLGARLRRCGVDVNFAPVADLDVDPQNPIVGVRAFGSDPDLVARHVRAFVDGQQSWRVAATAKHFPGHGATDEDSHVTAPTIGTSLDLLDRRELVPFRAAIAAGVQIVMTAHITVPALDPLRPATLSRVVITDLLRERLGFGGVVMTDALDMHAVSRTVGVEEGAVLALGAGVDAVCLGGEPTEPEVVESVAGALADAVMSGRLDAERLAEAAGRVRRLARWVGVSPAGYSADGGGAVGARAAQRAVVAVGDVAVAGPPLVLELQDEPSIAAGQIPWGVGGPLTERLPGTVVVAVAESGPDPVAVLSEHPDRPVIVAVRGARRRAWQADVVAAIRALRHDLIVVDHELPADPAVLGDHYVLAFGAARVTADTVADLVVGQPVNIRSESRQST